MLARRDKVTNITTQCRLQAPSPARLGRRRDGGLSVTLRCNTTQPLPSDLSIRRSAQRRLTGLLSNGLDLSIQAEQAEQLPAVSV